MKRFFKSIRKSIKGKNEHGSSAARQQQQQDDAIIDLTGSTPHSRNDADVMYISPDHQPPKHQPNVETYSGVNSSGRRVTTTTVRVPPTNSFADESSLVTQDPGDEQHLTTEQTRELVKKFIADIWNRGEVDLIPDVCSPSLRFNGNSGFDRVGHEGLARMVVTIRESLDEYHCEIHSLVVEGKKAFARLRFTGRHVGNLLGYEPTGKVVAWMGATEFTIQNGLILKVWELGDVKSLEEQLMNDKTDHSGSESM